MEETEQIIVTFKSADGREWSAAGEILAGLVDANGSGERSTMAEIKSLGTVSITDFKVVESD